MAGKPESLIIALMFAFLGIFIGQDLHRLLCTWTDLRESVIAHTGRLCRGVGEALFVVFAHSLPEEMGLHLS